MSANARGLLAAAIGLALASASAGASAQEPFEYLPPGDLITGSGEGRVDFEVYAPGMRFPMETGPAFANSQVYNPGGGQGPGGGQCDAFNYSYPWQDNYCEIRQWDMPLCPAGTGHQGQDIRAATCDKDVHWVVAAVDGTITNIGSYSVYLTAADGTRYDYLHMGGVQVAVGEDVAQGQRIGRVSNEFGGTPTTIHLHFNLRQNVAGVGTVYVPPYMSLVEAYEALVGPSNAAPEGQLDEVTCDLLRGWTRDPDAPAVPIEARLAFDGAAGHAVPAGVPRDDLCEPLGFCDHGFEVGAPLSLFDGAPHEVRAYGVDTDGGDDAELEGSPRSFECDLPAPGGVRRHVVDPASMEAWRFSSFWDLAVVDDATLDALPTGDDLPAAPELVRADDGSPDLWLVDGSFRRLVASPAIARAWELDAVSAIERSAAEIAALDEGTPLRPRPLLVKGSGPAIYLVDDPQVAGSSSTGPGASNGSGPGAPKGEAAAADAGCSCGVAPSSRASLAWLGLALAAGLARRRPRRARA